MTQLESVFAAIRDYPVPSALDEIEGQVLAGMKRLRDRKTAVRSVVLASAVAVMVGIWGGNPGPAQASQPLLGVPAIAPSSLLND